MLTVALVIYGFRAYRKELKLIEEEVEIEEDEDIKVVESSVHNKDKGDDDNE